VTQERTKQLMEEQQAEEAAIRMQNMHVASFQKHQSLLKAKIKDQSKLRELQEAAMLADMSKDAEDRFKRYAKELVEEYRRQGKPIKPMEVMLSKPKPFESA
jgi:hypothetical protein